MLGDSGFECATCKSMFTFAMAGAITATNVGWPGAGRAGEPSGGGACIGGPKARSTGEPPSVCR